MFIWQLGKTSVFTLLRHWLHIRVFSLCKILLLYTLLLSRILKLALTVWVNILISLTFCINHTILRILYISLLGINCGSRNSLCNLYFMVYITIDFTIRIYRILWNILWKYVILFSRLIDLATRIRPCILTHKSSVLNTRLRLQTWLSRSTIYILLPICLCLTLPPGCLLVKLVLHLEKRYY